jgi:hypothetical protein
MNNSKDLKPIPKHPLKKNLKTKTSNNLTPPPKFKNFNKREKKLKIEFKKIDKDLTPIPIQNKIKPRKLKKREIRNLWNLVLNEKD